MSIISEYINSCQCSKQGSLKINWCVCGGGEAVWLAVSVVYAQVMGKYAVEIGTRAQRALDLG